MSVYANMVEYFTASNNGADWIGICAEGTYVWTVPKSVKDLVPKAGTTVVTRGQQSVTDPLSMTFFKAENILSETASWFKQIYLVNNNLEKMKATNKEYRPAVMPMRTAELLFEPGHDKGHCWALATSSSKILARRSINPREHVRTVPNHFTVAGKPGNKSYVYHIMAYAAAFINEIKAAEKPGQPKFLDISYTIEDLQTVTKGKTASSTVICHGCGNAFCVNPSHFHVSTKAVNDEEECCHHFLRKMKNAAAYSNFVANVCSECHNSPAGPCWANVYDPASVDAQELALSQPPAVAEDDDVGEQDPSII